MLCFVIVMLLTFRLLLVRIVVQATWPRLFAYRSVGLAKSKKSRSCGSDLTLFSSISPQELCLFLYLFAHLLTYAFRHLTELNGLQLFCQSSFSSKYSPLHSSISALSVKEFAAAMLLVVTTCKGGSGSSRAMRRHGGVLFNGQDC